MDTVDSRPTIEPSLAEFLAQRARRSSDARLAIDAGAGLVVALASVLWRGPGWYALLAAGLCFLGYGAWAIADRELAERLAAGRPVAWLRATRVASLVAGVASAIAFALFALNILLGKIQS